MLHRRVLIAYPEGPRGFPVAPELPFTAVAVAVRAVSSGFLTADLIVSRLILCGLLRFVLLPHMRL
jgi:hypothetical protein